MIGRVSQPKAVASGSTGVEEQQLMRTGRTGRLAWLQMRIQKTIRRNCAKMLALTRPCPASMQPRTKKPVQPGRRSATCLGHQPASDSTGRWRVDRLGTFHGTEQVFPLAIYR